MAGHDSPFCSYFISLLQTNLLYYLSLIPRTPPDSPTFYRFQDLGMPYITSKSPLYDLILTQTFSEDPVISFCYLLIFVQFPSVQKSDLKLSRKRKILPIVLFIDTTVQTISETIERQIFHIILKNIFRLIFTQNTPLHFVLQL